MANYKTIYQCRECGATSYQRVLDRVKPFQDRVAEHQRNIEALRQEMAKLK